MAEKAKSNLELAMERGNKIGEEIEDFKKSLSITEWLACVLEDSGGTLRMYEDNVQKLLERNDIEINRKFNSFTLLQMAVAVGQPESVIRKMIDLKADVNAVNNEGCSAISYVQNRDILDLLLNSGADLTIGNNQKLFKKFQFLLF